MYSFNQERSVYLPQNAVEIDQHKGILRINIAKTGYNRPEIQTHEYPLLRHTVCQECKTLVSIYATGSCKNPDDLFLKPWKHISGWKLLQGNGSFALVANDGHNFALKNKDLEPQCFCDKREAVPVKARCA